MHTSAAQSHPLLEELSDLTGQRKGALIQFTREKERKVLAEEDSY
jgi:hypothetical protein